MNKGIDDLGALEEYTIICLSYNGLDTTQLSKAAKKAIARNFISHFGMYEIANRKISENGDEEAKGKIKEKDEQWQV